MNIILLIIGVIILLELVYFICMCFYCLKKSITNLFFT